MVNGENGQSFTGHIPRESAETVWRNVIGHSFILEMQMGLDSRALTWFSAGAGTI